MADKRQVFNWDRGADVPAADDDHAGIVDFLAGGLADHIYVDNHQPTGERTMTKREWQHLNETLMTEAPTGRGRTPLGSRRRMLGGAGRPAGRRVGFAPSPAGGGLLEPSDLSRNARARASSAGGSAGLTMAALPFTFPRSSIMSKKTTTAKPRRAAKAARAGQEGRQGPVLARPQGRRRGAGAVRHEEASARRQGRRARRRDDAKATKPAKAKKAKEPKAKKVGALDAAAQVLAASKEPLNCKAMIEAMAKKGLWTSPGGKTPHATLYCAIIREIATQGERSPGS